MLNNVQPLQVANIINDQIGGRAFFMMGTQHKLGGPNDLTFNIRGSVAFNKVKVTLTPDDTYTVEFYKTRKFNVIRYKKVEGVYVDQLKSTISESTGLALSM
jgi:hypothetical protein